ncbi:MAG: hypothetical protein ACREL5_09715 [Gemmatimonadales bacterium]
MRVLKAILTSIGMLSATAATAMAAPMMVLQNPQAPTQVEVHTTETHVVWYLEPMWLAIGAIAVVLIIVLIVMAARGREGGGTSTTVIK